jgi:hypothetical protein
MIISVRTSKKPLVAFVLGMLSLGCGILALFSSFDLFLLGIPLFWLAALGVGIVVWREAGGNVGHLRGQTLAKWGIGAPVGGACLGFLLMPFT